MGENIFQLTKGLISVINKDLKEINTKEQINEEMSCTKHPQRKSTNGQYTHEEMFNMVSHKGNANCSDTEIPSDPSQNGYHEKTNDRKCW
jgi:hypothetical protein